MASSRGLIAINNVANNSKQNSFGTFTNLGLNSLIVTGRVISIILDETHPRFTEFGEWNGLGTIEFDLVSSPTPPNQLYPTARPVDPSIKSFPLINEVVYILALPNTNIGEFSSTKTNYYINTVGIWNHPHHNAFPQNSNVLPPSQQKDYVETELGSVRRVTDQSTEIFLGRTFIERGDIHPLLPFEGDKIIEGRWGNSIRLGSTVKDTLNTWSSTGTNGDPITIIRNGQGNQTEEGWIPTIEDINNDDTSIYFTSTQKIPLEASSINDYFSYQNNPPTRPNEYAGKQIILNSGRLVFNTTEDHLLLSSKKSINLNAVESINFDTTGPTILQSGEVYLGSKNATEPVLLGQSTINLLQTLLQELATLTNILSLQVGVPPGAPLAPTNTQAALTNTTITNLITQLNGLLSNSVKTV
jgi:hypothetical protein